MLVPISFVPRRQLLPNYLGYSLVLEDLDHCCKAADGLEGSHVPRSVHECAEERVEGDKKEDSGCFVRCSLGRRSGRDTARSLSRSREFENGNEVLRASGGSQCGLTHLEGGTTGKETLARLMEEEHPLDDGQTA